MQGVEKLKCEENQEYNAIGVSEVTPVDRHKGKIE